MYLTYQENLKEEKEFSFYNLITLQNPTKEASRILQIQLIAKQLLKFQVVFFY